MRGGVSGSCRGQGLCGELRGSWKSRESFSWSVWRGNTTLWVRNGTLDSLKVQGYDLLYLIPRLVTATQPSIKKSKKSTLHHLPHVNIRRRHYDHNEGSTMGSGMPFDRFIHSRDVLTSNKQAVNKIVVNQIPIPVPGPNQFLVKTTSASLCHSDLMAIDTPGREKPVTLGHEGAGTIAQIHPSAEGKGFKTGDVIGFLYVVGCCFECDGCLVHNLHCESGKQLLQGFTTDGFFAEYAVVDYQNAIILPPSLDPKTASPIFCAGITAFHSVDSSELKEGDWFGVVGCGGLGQLATQYAKAMGAKVVGIDINDDILASCTSQGADAVFNSRTNPNWAEEVKALTKGGAKAVAVYSNAQVAYATAPSIIKLGGILMVIGIAHKTIDVSTMDLTTGRYRVKSESTSIPQRMGKAIEFTAKHNITPDVQIFDKLEDLAEMEQLMRSGKATKRMVVAF